MRKYWLIGALALAACSSSPEADSPAPDSDSIEFPFDGTNWGKDDVFGRSLVGTPSPYAVDATLGSQENELRTNMKLRREVAWATTKKVLEPVPLLGLLNQLEARPECRDAVEARDLRQCAKKTSEADCAGVESGGVAICGWDTEATACDATCDRLTLPDGVAVPSVPRFSTWYGVEDLSRIFRYAYAGLSEDERVARAPLSDALIGEAMLDNVSEIERSNRWPLERYTKAVVGLLDCSLDQANGESNEDFADRCAQSRQSDFSGAAPAGGGIARLVYSPATVLHTLRNYGEVLDCADDKLTDTWCAEGEPCTETPENFSRCFRAEFPADAGSPWADEDEETGLPGLGDQGGTVVIKATWARVGFGFELPVYDTDAAALKQQVDPGKLALWDEEGDRAIDAATDLENIPFPTPDDIHTIQTRSGSVYRLTALHIMTKELRHWQWITLWWSDTPDSDFGADRPDSFEALPSAWSNYKMCVVVDYLEGDADAAARFGDFPTLQEALQAVNTQAGQPSWCSNPYIERGAGNARTNCIGCHQHAGSRYAEDSDSVAFELKDVISEESVELTTDNRFPANGRIKRRNAFATDYSWAFSRLDDLTELIRSDVEFAGASDERWSRINTILAADADIVAGEQVFRETTMDQACTDCHGDNGEGGFGPDYQQVFSQKTDWQMMSTIIDGRASMPAWGETLSDEELANLFGYLRANFDPTP